MINDQLELFLKYENEDEYLEAYKKKFMPKETKYDNLDDLASCFSNEIVKEINYDILGKLFWMTRDKVLTKYYRTKKLERILNGK